MENFRVIFPRTAAAFLIACDPSVALLQKPVPCSEEFNAIFDTVAQAADPHGFAQVGVSLWTLAGTASSAACLDRKIARDRTWCRLEGVDGSQSRVTRIAENLVELHAHASVRQDAEGARELNADPCRIEAWLTDIETEAALIDACDGTSRFMVSDEGAISCDIPALDCQPPVCADARRTYRRYPVNERQN